MSGLPEIEQWVEDNIQFDRFGTPEEAFDFIDEQFSASNRLPLDDILQEQKGEFMEFLTSMLPRDMDLTPEIDPIELGPGDHYVF